MKYFLLFFLLICGISFSQKKNTTNPIDSLSYYGNLRDTKIKANKYNEAFFYALKAISYAKTANNIRALAKETCNLGKLYYDVKKYDDAIKLFDNSLTYSKKNSPSAIEALTYYHLGMCYMKKKRFDKAEINFIEAESINTALKFDDPAFLISLQKGIIFKSKKKYDLASSFFSNIIVQPDNSFIIDSKAEALYQIGTIEMTQNRSNLALNYLKKALELNSKNKNLEQKSAILKALSSVFEKMLDKNNAYTYLKQHSILEESIAIIDHEKLGIDDYEKFKESEKLKVIAKLNEKSKQQEKSNKFSKLISILAIALISILSLLSLSLYKNNIIRTQTNTLLEEKNKELIIAKEKVEKASNARADFLSTVSHELRTPLNAINGITHLLLKDKPKKTQMHYLESLQFSGNYLTNFINDILEINKIDSSKAQVEKINFNLKLLLENIHSSLKELATDNNNNFDFSIDPEIPNFLIGDPTKLSQILMNLINNALKFTTDGDVLVTAKVNSLHEKNATLFFKVQDNGIGIPEDKIATVFESFSQGSTDINRKYGGTGLGLTIVKKLVKVLGGEIKLESKVNEGSTFSFEIPFIVAKKPREHSIKKKNFNNMSFSNKKILVVEDNKINQMITKKMLESIGIECEIIDNGEDSVEKCKEYNFDLILMDVHLPGINGTIATQLIREFDNKTPVIALTAISLNENREMLLSYGMNDIITKPFVPEDFYTIITKYI